MAEPAALAIGVAGLSSILGSTMDQIQHFKLGRNFDTTFETDKIRFAYAEHRFSRACKSLGVDLKESNEDVEAALTKVISPGSIEITCKVARKAHDLCEQARRKSENIGRVSKGGIKDAADEKRECPQRAENLLTKVRKIDKLMSFKQKFGWAYLDKDEYEEFIEKFIELVKKLEAMVPDHTRQSFAQGGISELGVEEVRQMLDTVAVDDKGSVDPLRTALRKTETQSGNVFNTNFSGATNYGMMAGQSIMEGGTFNFGGSQPHSRDPGK